MIASKPSTCVVHWTVNPRPAILGGEVAAAATSGNSYRGPHEHRQRPHYLFWGGSAG